MTYISRHAEATADKAAKMFPVVLITGARQVGKTTLLKHMTSDIPYLTLDDPILLQNAIEEAGSF
ncbi:MAG TPA: ATPase, partial [Syntrophomonas wolfei]|nr:ATPase [Syntrophomonas wolfei]